jgi:hypothetical protein
MMKSLPTTTLERLGARPHVQARDVAHLRAALDTQVSRISQMYDHHGLPQARECCQFQRPRTTATGVIASGIANSKEK